jgi:hypothetical protein
MSVAIDYTASNGEVSDPKSYHFINEKDPEHKNEYEIAMYHVGKVLDTYAYKHKFMAYGFGGKPEGAADVSHCFPLNGNENDPSITGLETKEGGKPGLLETYKDSLSHVQLYGPTLFEPVHKSVIKFVNKMMGLKDIQLYHVLLILTDGCIHDMRTTIDQIVEGSLLPLSIIIVGIGNADFSNMEILDADNVDLVDSKLNPATRDIVQFVKYNDYQGDIGLLAEQVLCEVPD